MTSYTPGPWGISSTGNIIALAAKGGDCLIAKISRPSTPAKRANAYLLAAAPELLESLEGVLEWIGNYDVPFDQNPDWNAQKQCAYAAVAKARCQETTNESI